MLVHSFRDIRKLKLKRDVVQITKAGAYFKARFNGNANCVFASTEQEARERLLQTPLAVKDSKRNSAMRKMNSVNGFRKGCAA